jgi:hypothetical protein
MKLSSMLSSYNFCSKTIAVRLANLSIAMLPFVLLPLHFEHGFGWRSAEPQKIFLKAHLGLGLVAQLVSYGVYK